MKNQTHNGDGLPSHALFGILESRINAARAESKKLRDEIKGLKKEMKDAKRQIPKKEQKSAIAARPRRLEIFWAVANGKTYQDVGVEYGMTRGRARQIVLMEWKRLSRDHYVMYKGEVSALRANPLPNAYVHTPLPARASDETGVKP